MFASVLLVDDHSAILEGLRSVIKLRYPGVECHTAASLPDARNRLATLRPSLAVLDLSIAGASGLELISQVRSVAPDCRILIYTMHPETQFGLAALRAGAHGYVTKDKPLSELTQALHQLEAGQRYISLSLAESLPDAVGGADTRTLSAREQQTLRMLASGLALKEIAATLGVSIKTVSTYRARILEKLRLSTTADLIRYALVHEVEKQD